MILIRIWKTSCCTCHHCRPSCRLSRNLWRRIRWLRLCIRSHLFLLSRTLSPVPSCGMFHSRRRTNVRQLTYFRHFWFLPLSPTMIRPLPRSHRTCRMTLDTCRRIVRLLWTSTLRRMQTCCWGFRRNATPVFAVIACSSRRCFGSGVSRDSLCRGASSGARGGAARLVSGGPLWCGSDSFGVGGHSPGVRELTGVPITDDVIPTRSESGVWTTSARPSVSRVCWSAWVGSPAQPHTGLLVDPRPGYLGSSSVAARPWPHHVEFTGVGTVCDVTESDVIRSHVFGVWARTIPVGGNPVRVSSCSAGGSLHGSYGFVASTWFPGCSWTSADCFPDLRK